MTVDGLADRPDQLPRRLDAELAQDLVAVISLLTTAEELNAAARLALQAGLKRQSELQEQVAMPVAFAARLNAGPIWPMTW